MTPGLPPDRQVEASEPGGAVHRNAAPEATPMSTLPATPLRNLLARLPRGETLLVLVGLVLLAGIVFLTQNRVVGFEPGYNELQPKHHGWVSSHTLAIIRHATWSNAFVGYAESIVSTDGQRDFDYFDRYPVFFSVAMNGLLSLKTRLSTQIYLAKQAMNLIFLMTLVMAFLLVRKLTGQTLAAAAIAVVSMSSPYLLFYKDMVHYDQPALLGMMLLLYAIALFKIDGRRRIVYPAVLISVGLGRGYASLAVLGTWLILETLPLIRQRTGRWSRFIRLTALRALILGVLWAGLCLSYNIAVESIRREVPPLQTSIVQSARNRLALNEEFNQSYLRILDWQTFLSDQTIRVVRWSFPVWEYEGSVALSTLILAGLFGVIILQARRLDPDRRLILLLMALSGPVWLIGMRNLSAFHDYTAMYYLGIPLAFYTALVARLRWPGAVWLALALLSLAVFTYRNDQIQALHDRIGHPFDSYTHDFMRIAEALPGPHPLIDLEDGVPFAPYALGFYLPDAFQAPESLADDVISKDKHWSADNLTPANSHLFLFCR